MHSAVTNRMPQVVTHRYDPARGPYLNLCSLPNPEAVRLLDQLRRETRPRLKPDYLLQRRAAEQWLLQAATKTLRHAPESIPVYFFLGDFSYGVDHSRPASVVLPLAQLHPEAVTFTLGDSMRVAAEPNRCVYNLEQMEELFAAQAPVADFGLTDREQMQPRFIEMQLWDRSLLPNLAV